MNIVFYHKNCCDGLFAAYVSWLANKDSTLLVPVDHRDKDKLTVENILEKTILEDFENLKAFSCFTGNLASVSADLSKVSVFIVDFSFSPEVLEYLASLFKRVVLLDHHETTVRRLCEAYPDGWVGRNGIIRIDPLPNLTICLDSNHCGSYMAYQYFHGRDGETVPRYLELVNDHDLHKKQYKETEFFVAAVMAHGCETIRKLDNLIKRGTDALIDDGFLPVKIRRDRTYSSISRRTEATITHGKKKYRVALVNTNLDISTPVGEILVTKFGYDIGISYSIVTPTVVAFSTRSKAPLSTLFLSEHFGGGGHKQASGFSAGMDLLNRLLETGMLEIPYE